MVDTTEWRPIQFFLDEEPLGVAEVQTRTVPHDETNNLILFRCTCKSYSLNSMEPCLHIAVVFARIQMLGGHYVTMMRRPDIDPALLVAANQDLTAYRHLMLHESNIEVLDGKG